jgi:hypothetical protein
MRTVGLRPVAAAHGGGDGAFLDVIADVRASIP